VRDTGKKRYYGGAKCVAQGHDSRFHSVGPWLRVQDAGLRCFRTNICLWFCGIIIFASGSAGLVFEL
jgi:hypothetical protein